MEQSRDEFHQSRGRAATCKVCFGQALPRFSQQSIHTSFDDDYSTNPKPIPLEAHAPPQHLILRGLPYFREGGRVLKQSAQFTPSFLPASSLSPEAHSCCRCRYCARLRAIRWYAHAARGLTAKSSQSLTWSKSYGPSMLAPAQLVELKNGETYNGELVACDNWMNIRCVRAHVLRLLCRRSWPLLRVRLPLCAQLARRDLHIARRRPLLEAG